MTRGPVFPLLLPLLALLCTACSSRTPALEQALDRHPDLGSGVYEELGRWEEALGEPETVPQADGGTTFFYWPEHGLAVFTHPLYEGQYRAKERENRKITSVILPLKQQLRPSFLPVAPDVVLQFHRLPDSPDIPEDLPEASAESTNGRCHHVDTASSPLRKTSERVHVCGGEPVAVEIRDTWWLSHYD